MRKLILVLVACFGLMLPAMSGCGDTCTKAWDKWESCLKKQGAKGDMSGLKKETMKMCKKKTSHFKKCLKIKDCKKYDRCIENMGKKK